MPGKVPPTVPAYSGAALKSWLLHFAPAPCQCAWEGGRGWPESSRPCHPHGRYWRSGACASMSAPKLRAGSNSSAVCPPPHHRAGPLNSNVLLYSKLKPPRPWRVAQARGRGKAVGGRSGLQQVGPVFLERESRSEAAGCMEAGREVKAKPPLTSSASESSSSSSMPVLDSHTKSPQSSEL